jgi:hypothetical protein
MRKRRADSSVKAAVEAYLDGVRLEGAQKPLGALAVVLAESLGAAPGYARGKLARELRELLTVLDAQGGQGVGVGGAAGGAAGGERAARAAAGMGGRCLAGRSSASSSRRIR